MKLRNKLCVLLLAGMQFCNVFGRDLTEALQMVDRRSEVGAQLVLYGVSFNTYTRFRWGIEDVRSSYKFKTLVANGFEFSYQDSMALIEAVGSIRESSPTAESSGDMRLVCEVFHAGQLVEVFGLGSERGAIWIDGKWFEPTDAVLFDKIAKYLPWYIVPQYQKKPAEDDDQVKVPDGNGAQK